MLERKLPGESVAVSRTPSNASRDRRGGYHAPRSRRCCQAWEEERRASPRSPVKVAARSSRYFVPLPPNFLPFVCGWRVDPQLPPQQPQLPQLQLRDPHPAPPLGDPHQRGEDQLHRALLIEEAWGYQQRMRRLFGKRASMAFMSPGAPSEVTQGRHPQAPPYHVPQKPYPALLGLLAPERQVQQHLAPIGGDAPGSEYPFLRPVAPQALVDGVQEQLLRLYAREVPLAELPVVLPEPVGDLRDRRSGDHQFPADLVPKALFDVPGGKPPDGPRTATTTITAPPRRRVRSSTGTKAPTRRRFRSPTARVSTLTMWATATGGR
jgi:hypothetical protein